MFEEMELDAKDRISTIRCNKVLNEEDVFSLHIIKIVCEIGKLINGRSKRFLVSGKYKNLLADEKAGELYFRV